MRKVLIVLLAGMLLMGCQKSATQQQLQQIDSMLTDDKVEKAYAALEKLEPESMRDDEDKAYYWLLKHESELDYNYLSVLQNTLRLLVVSLKTTSKWTR